MTNFSPEMQQQIDALKQGNTRLHETRRATEQARRDTTRNSIERLAQDARALGEIALQRGRQPYTTVNRISVREKSFRRPEEITRTPVLKGWGLTWKHIIGMATNKDIKPQWHTVGLVTLIGEDCKLYVAETQSIHTTNGLSNTEVITGGFSYSHPPTDRLVLALSDYSQLGADNPLVLSPSVPEFVLEHIDADVMNQAMLTLADNKQLY